MTTPSSELHLILVWHNALDQAERILADAEEHFTICDVLRIHWSPERFSRNLTKFYDDDLPPGSDKERHCGVGEFLLVVVEDGAPDHARRPVSRGGLERVSTNMHAAKARYREWTGGGHQIHTSLDSREFARDSFLLLGRHAERYRPGGPPWDGSISDLHVDLVGTDGWEDVQQLARGLELTGPFVVLERTAAGDLTLLVDDFWSATVMATGAKPAEERVGRHELSVGGRRCILELHELGGGHLDPDWEDDMLARRVWDAEGLPVLSAEDRLHYLLYRGDRDADAQRSLDDYLARMGYGEAHVRAPIEPSRLHSVVHALRLRAARAAARVYR
jgi:hypothetical protein